MEDTIFSAIDHTVGISHEKAKPQRLFDILKKRGNSVQQLTNERIKVLAEMFFNGWMFIKWMFIKYRQKKEPLFVTKDRDFIGPT